MATTKGPTSESKSDPKPASKPGPKNEAITFDVEQFERMLRAMRLDKPQMKEILAAAQPNDERQKAILKALETLAAAAKKLSTPAKKPKPKNRQEDEDLINSLGLNPDKQPSNRGDSFPKLIIRP